MRLRGIQGTSSIGLALASLAAALVACAALTSGVSFAGGRDADPSGWRLGPKGIGPLRLGMSAAQARAIAPGLRVAHHRFCDTWTVPGLRGVSMFSTHERGGLSGASISAYSEEIEDGHGAAGVEIGAGVHELKQRYGKRLRFVESSRSLGMAFYRVYSRGGRRTAIEFTIDMDSRRVTFEEAGFVGEFYYTDGVELCA